MWLKENVWLNIYGLKPNATNVSSIKYTQVICLFGIKCKVDLLVIKVVKFLRLFNSKLIIFFFNHP